MSGYRIGAILVGLFSVLWIGAAWTASASHGDFLFRASTLIILALSWNLMANAGLISLAHGSFSGVGGYAACILAKAYGLPLWAVFPVAILAGAALGAFLALTTGRLSGMFFAIGTLAVAEGLRVIALMVPDLTGGALGIYVPPTLRYSAQTLTVAAAVIACICLVIVFILSYSRFHYACRAMFNGEAAAQMLGLDPRRYRFAVLAIAGAMTATIGALTAWYSGFLDPRTAFSLHTAVIAQIAPILGGLYTVPGPLIGALVLTGVSELIRASFGGNEGWGQLLYGVILVVCMLLMPQGIYGLIRDFFRRKTPEGEVAPMDAGPALPQSGRAAS